MAVAVLAGVLTVRVSFLGAFEMPPLPPEPEPPTREETVVAAAVVTAAIDYDPSAYAERLAGDSRALGIKPPATPADLSAEFPYRVDGHRRVLEPRRRRDKVEVLGLAMSLDVADIEGTPRRQFILTVENTTGSHLAYRIIARPSRGAHGCYEKLDIAHNAIALAPGEKMRRSECIYRKGLKLLIDRVETIALPILSYYYVSSLPAAAIGMERPDRLAARGHRPGSGRSPCRVFHSAELEAALLAGSVSWRDRVDFYARHPCGVYSFIIDYRAFERDGERPLPAVSARP